MTASLVVRSAGALSTVQDLGRPGWYHIGVGVAGAADRASHRLANRLLGNAEDAATVECLLGGLVLEATATVTVAVTGAPAPVTVDGVPAGHSSVVTLRAGQRLALGMPPAGLRAYVAVRGGLDVPAVLGSRSRDTLAGIGPEPLAGGRELPVGAPLGPWPGVDVAPVRLPSGEPVVARVMLGPRDDWFTDPGDLFRGAWRVSADCDRVGARLDRVGDAPVLRRRSDRELATEGVALGAIQVPPSGQPVVFLADHPVTGGYPVIGTVLDADIDRLAQARPAQLVHFRPAGGQPRVSRVASALPTRRVAAPV